MHNLAAVRRRNSQSIALKMQPQKTSCRHVSPANAGRVWVFRAPFGRQQRGFGVAACGHTSQWQHGAETGRTDATLQPVARRKQRQSHRRAVSGSKSCRFLACGGRFRKHNDPQVERNSAHVAEPPVWTLNSPGTPAKSPENATRQRRWQIQETTVKLRVQPLP